MCEDTKKADKNEGKGKIFLIIKFLTNFEIKKMGIMNKKCVTLRHSKNEVIKN